MGHSHQVVDKDNHFIINAITRGVAAANGMKKILIQHDHDSERFTFECPRFIEGHDMALCNKIEVHFINIGGGNKKALGVFTVTDLEVSDDGETVGFSWLISSVGTANVGTLTFCIRFACTEKNELVYQWFTGVNKETMVQEGIYNNDDLADEFSDIVEEWMSQVMGNAASAYQIAVKHGFQGTEEEWLASLHGRDGKDGISPVKGADYWTLSDKEEVKSFIRTELGVIENGSY